MTTAMSRFNKFVRKFRGDCWPRILLSLVLALKLMKLTCRLVETLLLALLCDFLCLYHVISDIAGPKPSGVYANPVVSH